MLPYLSGQMKNERCWWRQVQRKRERVIEGEGERARGRGRAKDRVRDIDSELHSETHK